MLNNIVILEFAIPPSCRPPGYAHMNISVDKDILSHLDDISAVCLTYLK